MNENISEKDGYIVIDFLGMAKELLKKWWIILLVASLCGIFSFVKSYFFTVPTYVSTAKVYTVNADKSGSADAAFNDLYIAEQLINDYEEIIKSRYVMESVVKEMKLDMTADELRSCVDVSAIEETRILEISVTHEDPFMAKELTNRVCKIAGNRIVDVMNVEAINIIDEARIPDTPNNNNVIGDSAKGFIAGVFLCALVILVVFMLDSSVKNQEDLLRMTGLTTLGIIPYSKDDEKSDWNKKSLKIGKKKIK